MSRGALAMRIRTMRYSQGANGGESEIVVDKSNNKRLEENENLKSNCQNVWLMLVKHKITQ